jgi:hypothetical protein
MGCVMTERALDGIDITSSLHIRPVRAPDYKAEADGMATLSEALAKDGDVLAALAEVALAVCNAESAGISVLELDANVQLFRWHAIRGAWASYQGQGLPRDGSPCGETVARRATVLMRTPHLVYPEVRPAQPPIAEVLLSPFRILGETLGTVWVVNHTEGRAFDREDARITERLAGFASNAFLVQEQVRRAHERHEELTRFNSRLLKILDRTEAQHTPAGLPSP